MFISDEYLRSINCTRESHHAIKNYKKPFIPVVVGNTMNWLKSQMGLLVSDAVYIDMISPNSYDKSLEDIAARLNKLL